jgi:hypothetical protein
MQLTNLIAATVVHVHAVVSAGMVFCILPLRHCDLYGFVVCDSIEARRNILCYFLLPHFCRHVKTPKRVKFRDYFSDIRVIEKIPSIPKSDEIPQEDIRVLISDWPDALI